jgi:hypothetical protein
MSALLLYAIFATATAFSACYEILSRAIRSLDGPTDVLVESKVVAYISMFCISFIFAPFMVFVIMIPGLNDAAVRGLTNRNV